MIFRQFFDNISSTYTYLISSGKGREALIIDPVLEKTDQYILLLNQLDLRLVKVIDTHIHADHISGSNKLVSLNKNCRYFMGKAGDALKITNNLISNNSTLKIGDIIFTGTPSGVGKVNINDRLEGFIENRKNFNINIK